MIKRILCNLLFLVCFSVTGQSNTDIENKVRQFDSYTTTEALFKTIHDEFNSDQARLKAMFSWITLHITYQHSNRFIISAPGQIVYFNKEDLARRILMKENELVDSTVKEKEGVCIHMALLFKKFCDYLSLQNHLIKGYARNLPEDIGVQPKFKNHVWNAVWLNNKWVLVDVTYGIDYDRNLEQTTTSFLYFDISKEKLNFTHFPSEERWRNEMKQRPLNQFKSLPMFWDTFLDTNAELVSPVVGKLKKGKNYITFKNLDKRCVISYKFQQEQYAQKPVIKRSGAYTNVIITSDKKGIMTIYFNNKSAVAFKVSE